VGERVEHVPGDQEGGALEREAMELVEKLGDREGDQERRQLALEQLARREAVDELIHGGSSKLGEAAIQRNATEWEDYRLPVCVRQPSLSLALIHRHAPDLLRMFPDGAVRREPSLAGEGRCGLDALTPASGLFLTCWPCWGSSRRTLI